MDYGEKQIAILTGQATCIQGKIQAMAAVNQVEKDRFDLRDFKEQMDLLDYIHQSLNEHRSAD